MWSNTVAIPRDLLFLSVAPLSPGAFEVYALNPNFEYVNALLSNSYLAGENIFDTLMSKVEDNLSEKRTLRLALLHPNLPVKYLERYAASLPFLVVGNRNTSSAILSRMLRGKETSIHVIAAIHPNAPIGLAAPILLDYWNTFSFEEPLRNSYSQIQKRCDSWLIENGWTAEALGQTPLKKKLEKISK